MDGTNVNYLTRGVISMITEGAINGDFNRACKVHGKIKNLMMLGPLKVMT